MGIPHGNIKVYRQHIRKHKQRRNIHTDINTQHKTNNTFRVMKNKRRFILAHKGKRPVFLRKSFKKSVFDILEGKK